MSISIDLYVCRQEDDASLWSEMMGLGPKPVEGFNVPAAEWDMLQVFQGTVDDWDSETIFGAAGVRPRHCFRFRPDFLDPEVNPYDKLTEIVIGILQPAKRDLVVTFEGDAVWLVRKDGRLQIDPDSGFRQPDQHARFERAGLDYEAAPLRNLIPDWERRRNETA